ncbi:alpha/beta fold hydrolase [Nocardia sp. XZ_19_231]|uniref:lipase family alpha/beta hydrolase n=1 Tax=Nocardia sp. XZ_19_231 TaxID=2769252 RepID=UPI00188F1254|nr:alpha/beta fold hydrolase [Nocardia sp. XZ_19_231]
MPRHLAPVATVAAIVAILGAPAAAAQPTAIANDWDCRPSPAHPNPVVLVHGTKNTAAEWNSLTPDLVAAGYCAFAVDYGYLARPILQSGGLGPLLESVDQVAAFIDRVLVSTGAEQVDIVAQSQGGAIAEYYAKSGNADRIGAEVLLAPPTHGTTLSGVVSVIPPGSPQRDPANAAMAALACPACADMETGSDFVRALNDGPITQPGIRYSVIATRYDTTVTPPGDASFIAEPGVTNVFVQDLCPGARTGHDGLPADPVVEQWILNQLDPSTARAVTC